VGNMDAMANKTVMASAFINFKNVMGESGLRKTMIIIST
jgi:hypothetical protein